MTIRPQNRCTTCGYTWYPRGKNVSRKCPNCGKGTVELAPSLGGCGGCLTLLIGAIILYSILQSKPRPPEPPPPRPAPTASESQASRPRRAAPTPARQEASPIPEPPPHRAEPDSPEVIASGLLEQARGLAARSDYDEALETLRRARDVHPNREIQAEIDRQFAVYVDEWCFKATCEPPPTTKAQPAPPEQSTGEPRSPPSQRTRTRQFVTVTLKSGRTIEGELVREDRNEVVVRSDRGTLGISREYIDTHKVEKRRVEEPVANTNAAPAKITPTSVPPARRFPGWSECVRLAGERPWARDLRQIPATVIDEGVLRHVPYMSHRVANFELNIYGDPDAPACLELGIVEAAPKSDRAKDEVVGLLASMLLDAQDADIVRRLSRSVDRQTRSGVVFEVTPPAAADAYGGWWISVYDADALERARASAAELAEITHRQRDSASDAQQHDPYAWAPGDFRDARPSSTARPSTTTHDPSPPPAAPGDSGERTVYVRGYYRKDGTYVQPHSRRAPRRR